MMHKAIQTSNDRERGCGWRKPGGLYLVSHGPARDCGRLPIPCGTCPCCGRGIKPSRAWTWVDGDEILRASPECPLRGEPTCETCPVHRYVTDGIGKVGLIWVGERHYPTVGHFNREAEKMGISRRLSAVPKGLEIGKTHVFLAHRKGILKGGNAKMGEEILFEPGIFTIFKPERIEAIVTGEESDDEIDALLKRGLTPVKVERVEEVQEELVNEEAA